MSTCPQTRRTNYRYRDEFNLKLHRNPQIYRDNFERAYIEATEAFYRVQAPDHLKENGVQVREGEVTESESVLQAYMKYADVKLREEEQRATKYLESCSGSVQNLTDSCVAVLIIGIIITTITATYILHNTFSSPLSVSPQYHNHCHQHYHHDQVLVTAFKDTILAECAEMIRQNETERLQLMFKLLDRLLS